LETQGLKHINVMYAYYGVVRAQHKGDNTESEEDDFRSEFHRNGNRKGFNDTKWKRNYSGVV